MIRFLVVPLLIFGTATPNAEAQSILNRRLYDRTKDEAAAKAAETAKAVASGAIFDREIENLETLSKLEIDSLFSGHARTSRNNVAVIATNLWRTVDSVIVENLASRLKEVDIDAKVKLLDAEIATIEAALKSSEAAAAAADSQTPAQIAAIVAAAVNQGIDVDNAAAALLGVSGAGGAETLALLGKVLAEAKVATDTVATNLKKVDELAVQLRKLQVDVAGIRASRLRLELDHKKNLRRIWQRGLEDYKRSERQINGYRSQRETMAKSIDDSDNKTVVSTIRTMVAGKNSAGLDAVLNAAHLAASLAARWDGAKNLAELREAHERHRHGILRNRLEARAMEVAIGAGTQRLAIFYRGGIRPEIIAQILQTAATASITGAIAVTR